MPPTRQQPFEEPAEEEMETQEASELARAAVRVPKKPWHENPMIIWAFQGFFGVLMLLMFGYVVFWMDAHNDVRYKRTAEYEKDQATFLERYKDNRAYDKADRDAIKEQQSKSNTDMNKRLDRFESQLDTIGNDIKSILRNPR